jgi:hypothetical protein
MPPYKTAETPSSRVDLNPQSEKTKQNKVSSFSRNNNLLGAGGLMPEILATQEAEIRRIKI